MIIGARSKYFVLIIVVIGLGLLSREFAVIPLWIGDVLWATMVFFMVRFLYPKSSRILITILSLAFCYSIEFSQLYKAEWIDLIRHTLLGRLVLGDTFLWGDLLSYTIGIGIALLIDVSWFNKQPIKLLKNRL